MNYKCKLCKILYALKDGLTAKVYFSKRMYAYNIEYHMLWKLSLILFSANLYHDELINFSV